MVQKEETDQMPFGVCNFEITTANEMLLNALIKYSMMLDVVVDAKEGETLNVDGLINSLLFEGMSRRIKDLSKRHGFDDSQDFVEAMNACKDGVEAKTEILAHEHVLFQKMHNEILSHIPIDEPQKKLPL